MGDVVMKCPTEIAITDRREKELNDLGFITLCHCKGTDYAAFFGGQTTNKPKVYNTNDANANARISSMLPYILAASRFAHYIKAIMRDKIGSFASKENISGFLNSWISDYVLLNTDASQDVKASYPLSEARVDVTEVAGKPGSYRAVVFLKPHFQLEELTVSLRLVANLPAAAA
jgi:type VI secretion system protein ImpC